MMKTFEAMLAAVLILTIIVLLSLPSFKVKTKYAEIRRVCESALLSMSDKYDFRALVLAATDTNNISAVKSYIDNYIKFPSALEICDENGICIGNKPNSKNYLTVTYLMDGNVTDYKMLQIKLYVWIFATAGV